MVAVFEPALFGLAAAVCWGTSDFFSRKPSAQIGYYLTNGYMQLISFIGLMSVSLLFGLANLGVIPSNPGIFAVSLLVGFLCFLAFLFLYRGYSKGIMSIVAPITGSYPMVTIILAFIFANVLIPSSKLLGISFVLVGIVLAGINFGEIRRAGLSGRPKKDTTKVVQSTTGVSRSSTANPTAMQSGKKTRRITEGASSAVVSCLFFGTLYFFLTFVTPVFGFILPVIIMRGGAALTSFALLVPLRQRLVVPSKSTLMYLIPMSTADTLGFVSVDYGIFSGIANVPTVITLSAMAPIVTMVLATLFYKERISAIQFVGAFIMIAGVVVILYS